MNLAATWRRSRVMTSSLLALDIFSFMSRSQSGMKGDGLVYAGIHDQEFTIFYLMRWKTSSLMEEISVSVATASELPCSAAVSADEMRTCVENVELAWTYRDSNEDQKKSLVRMAIEQGHCGQSILLSTHN